MNNLYEFIRKYGDLTFKEKPVTTIDIMIFSQIPYVNLSNCFTLNNQEIKLCESWQIAKKDNTEILFLGQKVAVKILDMISTKNRYKDLILKNYIYHIAEDTQFGAITIEVPNENIYVVFEGTDSTIIGWKEDFELAYLYPTKSQIMATNYLNKTIKLFGPKVVVCGHSKGGNLALVGAMNIDFLKKSKIKNIYSFDGPGLKTEEFKSLKYKLIKNRLINIIPNSSLIGVLLSQENINVVKSRAIGLFQHDVSTWIVDEDKLRPSELDKSSQRLDENIDNWLSKHDYKERKQITEGIFSVFEEAGMDKFFDPKENQLELASKVIKAAGDISEETKNIILTSIKILFTDLHTDFINDAKRELQDNIEKYLKR